MELLNTHIQTRELVHVLQNGEHVLQRCYLKLYQFLKNIYMVLP